MEDWREKLKKALKTPEQEKAEHQAQEAQHSAEVQRAVKSALLTVKKVFEEAESYLRSMPNAEPSVGVSSTGNSSLTAFGKTIEAKASPNREQIILTFENQNHFLLYNRTRRALVLDANQHADLDLEAFVGQMILKLAGL